MLINRLQTDCGSRWGRFAGFVAVSIAVLGPAGASPALAEQDARPAPQRPPDEAAYIAKLDQALAPLKAHSVSDSDAKLVREAVAALRANKVADADARRADIKDPTAAKLVDWIRLRAGYGAPSDYQAFLADNPMWPDRTLMTQRLEEALFTQGGSAADIKSYFKSREPQTGIGCAAMASAYLAEGDSKKAQALAAKAWREMSIPATLETGFLKRFGSLLTPADHKWRFDRLVTDDVRWADNRADRAALAKRTIPLLAPSEQAKATARLAVFNKSSNARGLMAALPDTEGDTGLAFHRAQLLRKAGKTEAAAKIILAIPPDPKRIANLDEWWPERRQLAYTALKDGDAKLAYALTKDAGPLTVNPLKEQTFMAGWIAFRYLNNKDDAERHFRAFANAADGPLSRAKAAYWLARVAEFFFNDTATTESYRNAAKNVDTFHGLLAMQKLQRGASTLTFKPPEFPSAAQIANFVGQDAARAVLIADKAGLSREYTRGFLTSLRLRLDSEAEAGMIAYLAELVGDTQMAVRIAKAAIARGQNLITFGYPLHPFPAYTPLRRPPETAFLLGIARQETEFETMTVSGAGAKGLLQVMTVTAKHVCSDYKIKCDIPRLLTDKPYNVTVASAYIADRMDEFGGSYVLGLAGYNAGPGRARQWIRENSDPRADSVDPEDWIERIPITETREYVTKVLSNIQVYRARLGETKPLRIESDLLRARGRAAVAGGD